MRLRTPSGGRAMCAEWWAWWARWALAAALAGAGGARELDPAACAARFDVQRDKIIRTEESREMGARYLSELDVGARAECLRLCCETDACDVFVFEEKSPGSCYLFDCGPPEDFRCKFTAHGNFSSGVLALSRRLAELQDRERLAHHERELASLRSPPSSTASTPPPARSTAPPRPPPPREPPPPPPALPTGRCSRYQFECRVGGECIAVYNACDGVPQCADASDEAPELGCPPPPEPAPPPTTTPPPTPQIQLQESVEEGSVAAPARPSGDAAVEGAALWPHRLTQAQPPHRYSAGSASGAGGSHIFSHKGGLLQEGAFEPPPARAPWPPRAWPPPPPPPPGECSVASCYRRAPSSRRRRARPGRRAPGRRRRRRRQEGAFEPPPARAPWPPRAWPPRAWPPPPPGECTVASCYRRAPSSRRRQEGAFEPPPARAPWPPRAWPPRAWPPPPPGECTVASCYRRAPSSRRRQEGAFEPPPARAPWPPRAWPPPPPPPDECTVASCATGEGEGEGVDAERGWGYARLDWPDVEPHRAWPVPPPRPQPELPLYLPAKTMPEMPMVYASQQHTLRDGPKKGFELSAGPAPPAAPPPAPLAPSAPPAPPRAAGEDKPAPVENTTKKKALKDNTAQAGGVPAEAREAHEAHEAHEAQRWADEHDGLSERPPAAVLLLVLGTLMTASLGALLACRARAARRRRRAHPRLALDADYLVNGMYL
ncbi:basic proline-rich protein [Maniola jurtina]|uniref:basic proline-rich protein n=1 Tax=Maniola jurtina TaxID=191418 RepID=UPI001E68F265|nr:basic proline-rich protein [Maniola jurtina]